MLTMLLTLLPKLFSELLLKPITFRKGFKMKVNEKVHLSEELLNIVCFRSSLVKTVCPNMNDCVKQRRAGNKK
jgi:hypothetical protein